MACPRAKHELPRREDTELVALRVGEHDPRVVRRVVEYLCPQRHQAGHLRPLVEAHRCQVEVQPVLARLRLLQL